MCRPVGMVLEIIHSLRISAHKQMFSDDNLRIFELITTCILMIFVFMEEENK